MAAPPPPPALPLSAHPPWSPAVPPRAGVTGRGEGGGADAGAPAGAGAARSQGGFACDPGSNARLVVCPAGTKAWRLEGVQAVVNCTNRYFTSHEGNKADNVYLAAGPELAAACTALEAVRIGEAAVTPGFLLGEGVHVVHTVGPRWFPKYATAAETALSHCYRASLGAAVEVGARTVAIGCLHTPNLAFPREDAARVALRTMRRFLERYSDRLDAVALCLVDKEDAEVYEKFLPLYFPRDAQEEARSRATLTLAETGNEHGEPFEPERRVRVESGPVPTGENVPHGNGDLPLDQDLHALFYARRTSKSDTDERDATAAFCARTPGPDERLKTERRGTQQRAQGSDNLWGWLTGGGGGGGGGGGAGKPPAAAPRPQAPVPSPSASAASAHAARLARAQSSDFGDLAAMQIIYADCGKDFVGRPVVLIVGAHAAPASATPEARERFLDYAAREMERVAGTEYVVVYAHANAGADTPFASVVFLRAFHAALSPDHRARCAAVYALHATAGLRTTWNLMGLMFDESNGWYSAGKLRFLDSLSELFADHVPFGQLPFPAHVVYHDTALAATFGVAGVPAPGPGGGAPLAGEEGERL